MDEMTPETLKQQAERFRRHDDWGDSQLRNDYDREAAFTLSHASAWETQIASLTERREALRELRIQMLAAKAELVNDEGRVAKVFAGRVTEWANVLAGLGAEEGKHG
jgi:hypothetical protein